MQARKSVRIMRATTASPATMQHLVIWHKKSGGGPGRNDAEERRPARAVPKRDLPLINIESQRDCPAH